MLGKLQCSDAAIFVLSTTDIVINIINTILSYRSFWIYHIGNKTQHILGISSISNWKYRYIRFIKNM